MHLITLAHTDYGEPMDDLAAWLKRQQLENNNTNWGIKVRELKLLDITFPEDCKEEVKSIIAAHKGRGTNRILRIQDMMVSQYAMQKAGFEKCDIRSDKVTPRETEPTPTIAYFYPIGFMPDGKDKKGKELL